MASGPRTYHGPGQQRESSVACPEFRPRVIAVGFLGRFASAFLFYSQRKTEVTVYRPHSSLLEIGRACSKSEHPYQHRPFVGARSVGWLLPIASSSRDEFCQTSVRSWPYSTIRLLYQAANTNLLNAVVRGVRCGKSCTSLWDAIHSTPIILGLASPHPTTCRLGRFQRSFETHFQHRSCTVIAHFRSVV